MQSLRINLSTATLLFLLEVLSQPQWSHANSSEVSACDILAGSPNDRNKVADGVIIRLIDTQLAEPACEAALVKEPTNSRLQFQYGRVFEAKKDYASAFIWYSKAAEQNYAPAQFNLGLMYEMGDWVNRDYGSAFSWYQKAANQQNADAQNNLGVLCRFWPTTLNYSKAFKWFQQAADNGSSIGYFNLGVLYHNGQGTQIDVPKSLAYWRQAAKLGSIEANVELVFSWAEAHFPSYLPGFAEALSNQNMPYPFDAYQYRHYTTAEQDIYLSYNPENHHLYYSTAPTVDKTIDLGEIEPFILKAMAYEKTINP